MKKIFAFLCLCTGVVVTMSAAGVLGAGNNSVLGPRVCLMHEYQWQESATGIVTVSEGDPYYCGGWTSTVVSGQSGTVTVEGGISPYHFSQALKLVGSNQVYLEVGDNPVATVSSTSTNVSGGITTTVDSVRTFYLVNEEWWVNGADYANVPGVVLTDGSIHITGGFAYYIETTITTTVTDKNGNSHSDVDESVAMSPIYRDVWLLVANGKHEFVNVADGTQNIVDVNIRQSGDTVWVTNLYGYGAPEVYMALTAEGTMSFPSQMIRDIPNEMSPNGNGLWMNSAVSGTLTTTAITWGLTTPTDNVQTWEGWRNNRLYYTDGTEFIIPGTQPQGIRGDVNNDGSVSIADVTALINALLNGNFGASDNFNPTNADCNLDNSISISDVTSLINYLLNGRWSS